MCPNILYPRSLKTKIPLNTCNIHYCAGDTIENEMGGACRLGGGEERHVEDFGEET
jgi:hypothetical protein